MNFGESLGYWYLRLNGFIPMSNFVLHQFDADRRYNADADLMAVRFPHVFEEVGGQPADWDNERFDKWQLHHWERTVCVFCEIKTGGYDEDAVSKAFSKRRLRYALRRLGVLPQEQCESVCKELSASAVCGCDGLVFAKVLMRSADKQKGVIKTQCHEIELSDGVAFIRDRMYRYRKEKTAARMFFPGDLIQLLAWEAGVEMVDETVEGGG